MYSQPRKLVDHSIRENFIFLCSFWAKPKKKKPINNTMLFVYSYYWYELEVLIPEDIQRPQRYSEPVVCKLCQLTAPCCTRGYTTYLFFSSLYFTTKKGIQYLIMCNKNMVDLPKKKKCYYCSFSIPESTFSCRLRGSTVLYTWLSCRWGTFLMWRHLEACATT